MDEITQLEQSGRNKRQQRKAEKKTPEAKAKRNRGRSQRNRGYRSENAAEKELRPYGFRRVPMSGAIDGWDGDLQRRIEDGRALRMCENKHREADWPTLRKWLAQEGADFLRLDAGHGKEPLFVLPRSRFLQLLQEAGYDGGDMSMGGMR